MLSPPLSHSTLLQLPSNWWFGAKSVIWRCSHLPSRTRDPYKSKPKPIQTTLQGYLNFFNRKAGALPRPWARKQRPSAPGSLQTGSAWAFCGTGNVATRCGKRWSASAIAKQPMKKTSAQGDQLPKPEPGQRKEVTASRCSPFELGVLPHHDII